MKIFGLGTDIVNIKRLEKVLKKKDNRFKARIFSKSEILYCDKKNNPFPHYAKRYAAKEALSKALGTGIRKGVNFPSQAAALALVIQHILGIRSENL